MPDTSNDTAAAPAVAEPTYFVHVTRPGGPMGLDSQGTPKQASADTLHSLAKEFNVPWRDIATLTFDTTDVVKIAEMLKTEGFGVSVSTPKGDLWLMSPGLQVKIPKEPLAKSKSAPLPTWARGLLLAGAGAAVVWLFSMFSSDGKDEPEDEPDDDPEDED